MPRANKSAGYTERPRIVCTKPVLSAVSITTDERRKPRLVGKRSPAVLKQRIAIYGAADLFARSLCGNKSPGLREAVARSGKSFRHALDSSRVSNGAKENGSAHVNPSVICVKKSPPRSALNLRPRATTMDNRVTNALVIIIIFFKEISQGESTYGWVNLQNILGVRKKIQIVHRLRRLQRHKRMPKNVHTQCV